MPRTLVMSTTTRQGGRLMPMKNPPHPGVIVLQECVEPLGLTITQAAEALGVTRNTLSELVNGKRGISPEMAVRIAKVFGGTEEGWLIQQVQAKLDPLKDRGKGPSPFVVGQSNYQKFLAVMAACTEVNIARRKGL